MLQPKGKTEEEKIQARKKEFSYKGKLTRTSKIVSEPAPGLKTKKATAVDNPMKSSERVAQSFPASKPKMKTLKGKIQMALYKAKNMKKG